ncbi:hypothetical protein NCS56_01381000 [Fusarium sp. Ph1]|nr:hypothetical protein NCS56_01381000 [Fusarium sp. Ph1]
MLRLVLDLLFSFAIGPTLGATRTPNWICDRWCSSNFPVSSARSACIRDAKAGKGVCFNCGPKASTRGKTLCGNSCVDTKKDKNNCGACRNVYQSCDQGSCICSAGLTLCGDACKNLLTDKKNCGSCGNICLGGTICSAGNCVCPAGMFPCNGVCKNLSKDKNNCGTCGSACQGDSVCLGGSCGCPSGKTWCNDGYFNLNTDSSSCGVCKLQCGMGGPCIGGTCTCPAGQTICFGIACTNLENNDRNCGSCGKMAEPLALDAAASVLPTKSSVVTGAPLLIVTR